MERKRVAFESLGCKLNYAETVQIEKEFKRRGFDVVDSASSADVFVINTCTVTQSADSDCRQIVRRALRSSPDAFVVVTGCYAQGKPEEVAQIDGVDLVLGAREKFHLFDFVDGFTKIGGPGDAGDSNYHGRIFVSPVEDLAEFGAADSAIDGARTRAFLKVQDGCDYSCSYCTIPRVRGKSRSPSVNFLVDQARQISEAGFKEVVLSGVNVGDFGSKDGHSLLDLLKALEQVDGVSRYRISSIEPNLLTKEIVRFVASSARFCKHFHLPMQNGADDVLRRMRRRYNSNQYREVVGYVRELIPDAGIGADVIVGFPGETNEIFEKSMTFIESLPLTYLHVFSYSEREGTASAGFGGNVDPRVRRKRSELLRMISTRKRYEFARHHVGKIAKVLIEEEVKNGKMYGFTSNYIRVEVDSNPTRVNEISDVLITGVSDNTALGQVIL
jgi:threonylcarbamoyladenosine tRNA methylthiotransferase MtaB